MEYECNKDCFNCKYDDCLFDEPEKPNQAYADYQRAYYLAHIKDRKDYMKAYYAAHKEEKRAYYLAHKEEILRKAHERYKLRVHEESES